MIIKTDNLELIKDAPKTYLTSGVSAAGVTLSVKNVAGAVANLYALVGEIGEENSEIKLISGVSGKDLTVAALTNDHAADTVVYIVSYNQVRIYKSTAGCSGSFSLNTTVDITPDSITTDEEVTVGTADAVKTTFYNEAGTGESGFSPCIPYTGFTFYSVRTLTDRVASLFGDPDFKVLKRNDVANWLAECADKLQAVAIEADESYDLQYVAIPMAADKELYGTSDGFPTDFKSEKKLFITYDGTNNYRASFRDFQDFDPDDAHSQTTPIYYFQGDQVGIKPVGVSGGTIKLWYYARTSRLDDDSDELPSVMRDYTDAFINYGLWRAFYGDKKWEAGDRYKALFEADKMNFASEISSRHKDRPRFVKSSDPDEAYLFGDED